MTRDEDARDRARERLWAAGFLLFFGLPLLLPAAFDCYIQTQGETAIGDVVTATCTPSGDASRIRCRVEYLFTTPEGLVVDGADSQGVAASAGTRVSIRFIRNRPGFNGLDRPGMIGEAIALVALGLAFTVPGIIIVFRVWVRRRLERLGSSAIATVSQVTRDGDGTWLVSYTYRDPRGAARNGTFREQASEPHPGDTGVVKFDPQRPGSSVWVAVKQRSRVPHARAPQSRAVWFPDFGTFLRKFAGAVAVMSIASASAILYFTSGVGTTAHGLGALALETGPLGVVLIGAGLALLVAIGLVAALPPLLVIVAGFVTIIHRFMRD